jgi:hypothetical protein
VRACACECSRTRLESAAWPSQPLGVASNLSKRSGTRQTKGANGGKLSVVWCNTVTPRAASKGEIVAEWSSRSRTGSLSRPSTPGLSWGCLAPQACAHVDIHAACETVVGMPIGDNHRTAVVVNQRSTTPSRISRLGRRHQFSKFDFSQRPFEIAIIRKPHRVLGLSKLYLWAPV